MIGIDGVASVQGAVLGPQTRVPAQTRPVPGEARPSDTFTASDAGQAVAQSSESDEAVEFRAEQVAAAKANLERGAHQVQELVRVVAARISGFVGG